MQAFGEILLYAIPGFLLLIIIEHIWGYYKGELHYRAMDTISSLSSGMTNITKSVLGLTAVVLTYEWMLAHWSLFPPRSENIAEIPIWYWIAGFIIVDFAGYWGHRLEHEINVLWNTHIIHHSSEEFNLACALRQQVSHIFNWTIVLILPAALLGVPAVVIAIIAPFHLFAQFWYHTRYIDRMGFLEYFMVTPSHHRVHHAINPEYLDKNYGQIFIIWDRMFGTFVEEQDEIPAVYGVKRPVQTWNPFWINFQHIWLLAQDAWRASRFWDKIRIWFMPTGWRPADVAEKYPVHIIENPEDQVKFDTSASIWLKALSYVQLTVNTLLLMYLFSNYAAVEAAYGWEGLLGYGLFSFLAVFSYTTLMDRNWHAAWLEVLKSAIGLFAIWNMGSWFGMDSALFSGASAIVAGWFIISALAVLAMVWFDIRPARKAQGTPAI